MINKKDIERILRTMNDFNTKSEFQLSMMKECNQKLLFTLIGSIVSITLLLLSYLNTAIATPLILASLVISSIALFIAVKTNKKRKFWQSEFESTLENMERMIKFLKNIQSNV